MNKIYYYKDFINDLVNEGKLYIEDESVFDEDINWEKIINVSKLWEDYQNGEMDLKTYNKQLALKLEENLDDKLSEFKDIIKKLKENKEEPHNIWNKLYDKADENLIKIKI